MAAPKDHDTASSSSHGNGSLPNKDAMEKAFKVDMDKYDVRTHHDGYKPSAIGAKAYTSGGDAAFFKGGAQASQGLVGHELTHVVQQHAGGVKPSR